MGGKGVVRVGAEWKETYFKKGRCRGREGERRKGWIEGGMD